MPGAQAIYQPLADAAATANGVPTNIFSALISKESGWNPDAIGSKGDYGLTQLIPSTASSLGVNQYNPQENLAGGAQVLARNYKQYGNWVDALSAYNTGLPASQSSTGAAYANSILTAAGYTDPNAPSVLSTLSAGLNAIAGSNIFGAGSLAQTAAQGAAGVAGATNAAANTGSATLSWLTGPGVVYIVAIGGMLIVSYFAIGALFRGPSNAK